MCKCCLSTSLYVIIISNSRESVSSDFQTQEKRVENEMRSEVFLTSFKVFGNTYKLLDTFCFFLFFVTIVI